MAIEHDTMRQSITGLNDSQACPIELLHAERYRPFTRDMTRSNPPHRVPKTCQQVTA